MEKFVTQEECETRRNITDAACADQRKDISKLFTKTRALEENLTHLTRQNQWFFSVLSSVLGGLLIWLITKT